MFPFIPFMNWKNSLLPFFVAWLFNLKYFQCKKKRENSIQQIKEKNVKIIINLNKVIKL